jgi:organic hydroperoxide reductase OsmC/OhrA
MRLNRDGTGEYTSAVLRPRVTVATQADADRAGGLHAQASAACFIARSVNFPVHHEPVTVLADPA